MISNRHIVRAHISIVLVLYSILVSVWVLLSWRSLKISLSMAFTTRFKLSQVHSCCIFPFLSILPFSFDLLPAASNSFGMGLFVVLSHSIYSTDLIVSPGTSTGTSRYSILIPVLSLTSDVEAVVLRLQPATVKSTQPVRKRRSLKLISF